MRRAEYQDEIKEGFAQFVKQTITPADYHIEECVQARHDEQRDTIELTLDLSKIHFLTPGRNAAEFFNNARTILSEAGFSEQHHLEGDDSKLVVYAPDTMDSVQKLKAAYRRSLINEIKWFITECNLNMEHARDMLKYHLGDKEGVHAMHEIDKWHEGHDAQHHRA